MTTKKKSFSRLSALVLGGLLAGLPATAAFAAEPTTAAEARALAAQHREQAEQYRALGGIGYTTGRVQREEADARKYDALAAQISARDEEEPVVTSPEAEHYAKLAAHYRAVGGAAYKTGLLQWAEAQQRKYEAAPVTAAPTTPEPNPNCLATKPAVMLACNQ